MSEPVAVVSPLIREFMNLAQAPTLVCSAVICNYLFVRICMSTLPTSILADDPPCETLQVTSPLWSYILIIMIVLS